MNEGQFSGIGPADPVSVNRKGTDSYPVRGPGNSMCQLRQLVWLTQTTVARAALVVSNARFLAPHAPSSLIDDLEPLFPPAQPRSDISANSSRQLPSPQLRRYTHHRHPRGR